MSVQCCRPFALLSMHALARPSFLLSSSCLALIPSACDAAVFDHSSAIPSSTMHVIHLAWRGFQSSYRCGIIVRGKTASECSGWIRSREQTFTCLSLRSSGIKVGDEPGCLSDHSHPPYTNNTIIIITIALTFYTINMPACSCANCCSSSGCSNCGCSSCGVSLYEIVTV